MSTDAVLPSASVTVTVTTAVPTAFGIANVMVRSAPDPPNVIPLGRPRAQDELRGVADAERVAEAGEVGPGLQQRPGRAGRQEVALPARRLKLERAARSDRGSQREASNSRPERKRSRISAAGTGLLK
jgi:hypothetical protein